MAVTPSAREENVYMAKLAKQAKRYEEMAEFMENVSVAVESEELTDKEHNLFSMAYKNAKKLDEVAELAALDWVSMEVKQLIQKAWLEKKMSQAELAKQVNEVFLGFLFVG